MLVIRKYSLDAEINKVVLPQGAQVLTVRHQHSPYGHGVKLWAAVDPSAKDEVVEFDLVTTGGCFDPRQCSYLGTVETPDGILFHVFRIVK